MGFNNGLLSNTDNSNWRTGILGNSIFFDGVIENGSIAGLDDDLNGIDELTISVWYNMSDTGNGLLIHDFDGGGFHATFLEVNPDSIHALTENSICDIGGAQTDISGGATFLKDRWYHLVVVYNVSGVFTWINGTFIGTTTCVGGTGTYPGAQGQDFTIGSTSSGTGNFYFTGRIDELGMWNTSFGQLEVDTLWNDGMGIAFGNEGSPLIINLNEPADGLTTNNASIIFNVTLIPQGGFDLVNGTLKIWYSNLTLFTAESKLISGSGSNTTTFNISNIMTGNYIWTMEGCTDSSIQKCDSSTINRTFTFVPFTENDFNFNLTVLETSTQEITLTVTTNTGINIQGADLIYDGFIFSNADRIQFNGNTFNLTKQIIVPQVPQGSGSENKSFFFNITVVNEGTGQTLIVQSSTQNQTVNELDFGFCSDALRVPVLNFTMKNELDGLEINASSNRTTFQETFNIGITEENLLKNFSFNNIYENSSRYNFCTNDN